MEYDDWNEGGVDEGYIPARPKRDAFYFTGNTSYPSGVDRRG